MHGFGPAKYVGYRCWYPRPPAAEYEASFEDGLRLGVRKEYVASAIAYRGALEAKTESADALNNLGWTLSELGFYGEARSALEKALVLRPGWELARNNLKFVESRER